MVLCLLQFLEALKDALPKNRVLFQDLREVLGQDALFGGVSFDLLDQRERARYDL